jgi:predicted nucleic acid-binding protein
MSELFADSFVFLAMLNRQDGKHAEAVAALSQSHGKLVTTAWVLTELADGLCAARTRQLFVKLESRLRGDGRVTIVPPDVRLYEAGLELYRRRGDKDWSLTDCISLFHVTGRNLRLQAELLQRACFG